MGSSALNLEKIWDKELGDLEISKGGNFMEAWKNENKIGFS